MKIDDSIIQKRTVMAQFIPDGTTFIGYIRWTGNKRGLFLKFNDEIVLLNDTHFVWSARSSLEVEEYAPVEVTVTIDKVLY